MNSVLHGTCNDEDLVVEDCGRGSGLPDGRAASCHILLARLSRRKAGCDTKKSVRFCCETHALLVLIHWCGAQSSAES